MTHRPAPPARDDEHAPIWPGSGSPDAHPGLTADERAAAAAYDETISSISDCFYDFDADDLAAVEAGEYGDPDVQSFLRAHAGMLHTWYLAVDTLLATMLTCTTERTSCSAAAEQYIEAAAGRYHSVRHAFEHATTVWLCGLDTGPRGTYPPNTNAVNLPMQTLTTF